MKESGLYVIKKEFFDLIRAEGGQWDDEDCSKRPTYCCIKDRNIEGLYWAIPTSDLSHRNPQQIQKYQKYIDLPKTDNRWAYYYIGRTNKPALFKISSCFPIIEKYIHHEFTVEDEHLIVTNPNTIQEINKRFRKILSIESRKPNIFVQHITDIKERLIEELKEDQ